MKFASLHTALMMRVMLRKLREIVEIDVDDLVGRWRHAGLRHDDQLVWREPDDCCDLPIASLMRQDSGKFGNSIFEGTKLLLGSSSRRSSPDAMSSR